MKIHRQHLMVLVKWAWITLVLACVGGFMVTKRELIAEDFAQFTAPVLVTGGSLLVLGKLALNAAMVVFARHCNIQLSRRDGFYIYNVAQLAKYVPGSIWQFVSRIAMLRARQASSQSIRDSMIAENGWVVGSALLVGGALVWLGQPGLFLSLARVLAGNPSSILILLLSSLVIAVVLTRLWRPGYWSRFQLWLVRMRPPAIALVLLLLAWLALGGSFWVCLKPFIDSAPSWPVVIGVYCLAWVAGFLVPFAPAGLGVREAVLAIALDPVLNAQTSLVVVAVNRVIYVLIEVLMAFFAWISGPDPIPSVPLSRHSD
jgi:uncharacterized membrane protein YbhN (UPF0104 family)